MYYSIVKLTATVALVGGGSVLGVWGVNSYFESIGVVNIYQSLRDSERDMLLEKINDDHEWEKAIKKDEAKDFVGWERGESKEGKVKKLKDKCEESKHLSSSSEDFLEMFVKFKKFCMKTKVNSA